MQKVVIDTSIFLRALITSDGTIAELILNPKFKFSKFALYFLLIEVLKNKEKILASTKFGQEVFLDNFYLLSRRIRFINEELIPKDILRSSYELVKDIDPKDFLFVALAEYLNARLWTSDKELISDLLKKGKDIFITKG